MMKYEYAVFLLIFLSTNLNLCVVIYIRVSQDAIFLVYSISMNTMGNA